MTCLGLSKPEKNVKIRDYSVVQGLVDFTKEPTDVRGVYHRCGVGNDRPDADFLINVSKARASGRVVGAYHFFYPLPTTKEHPDRDPLLQARKHFTASGGLGKRAGDLPPAVDFEWPAPEEWAKWGCTKQQIEESCWQYAAEMTRLHEVQPLVYTYPYWWRALGSPARWAIYKLWLASYTPTPVVLAPWTDCVLWQNTGGGGKLGMNGAPVDTDLISESDLAGLLRIA